MHQPVDRQSRQPKGSPVGGEFAAVAGAESTAQLRADTAFDRETLERKFAWYSGHSLPRVAGTTLLVRLWGSEDTFGATVPGEALRTGTRLFVQLDDGTALPYDKIGKWQPVAFPDTEEGEVGAELLEGEIEQLRLVNHDMAPLMRDLQSAVPSIPVQFSLATKGDGVRISVSQIRSGSSEVTVTVDDEGRAAHYFNNFGDNESEAADAIREMVWSNAVPLVTLAEQHKRNQALTLKQSALRGRLAELQRSS